MADPERAESNITGLLAAYDDLLRRVKSRPRRPWIVGTELYVLEHLRAVVGAATRGHARRVAVGSIAETSEKADLTRLARFTESLPPPPSAARKIILGVLIVVLAQALSAILGRFESLYPVARVGTPRARSQLLDALGDVASLSVSNVVKIEHVIVDAGLAGASIVATIGGLAAWIILRPLANGVVVARRLTEDDLDLHRREIAVLAKVDAQPPTSATLDLFVPALIAVPAVLMSLTLAQEYFHGVEDADHTFASHHFVTTLHFVQPRELLIVSIAVGYLGAVRLLLVSQDFWRRRTARSASPARVSEGRAVRHRRARSAIAAAVFAAAMPLSGYLVFGLRDSRPVGVELELTSSSEQTLASGRVTMKVRYTEPAEFDSATLRGVAGHPPQDGELETLKRPEDVSAVSGDVVLHLTESQRRWMRGELRSGAPYLDVLLFDDAANRTRIRPVFLD